MILSPKPGYVYRHYKGGLYEVIAVAQYKDSKDKEAKAITDHDFVVTYRDLATGDDWAQSFVDFTNCVEVSDGDTAHLVPRFTWLRSTKPAAPWPI